MLDRPEQFIYALGLLLYPLLVIAAAAGWQLVFGIVALATFGLEAAMPSRAADVHGFLRLAASDWTLRALLRSLSLVLLVARSDTHTIDVLIVAVCMLVLEAMRATVTILTAVVKTARTMPIVTRNIDLSQLRIPDRSARLSRISDSWIAQVAVLPMVSVVVWAVSGRPVAVVVGAGAAAAVAVAVAAAAAADAVKARRMPSRNRITRVVAARVRAYAPEVVVYLSGTSDSAYQINMWLGPAERLDRRVLIVLRERRVLAQLGPTNLPVLCVPSAVDLMDVEIPTLRVALYPANAAKNIHFIRRFGVRHIFIGHGDSDKVASINPFCKAYDEVWVAGPAGRERFARAAVGVEDHDIFEVGRPQLAAIGRESADRAGPLTVLYAPTWEGWTDEPQNSSLVSMGLTIVEQLLNHPDNIRLIYKPHPLTGVRSPDAAAVSAKIIEMIGAANARRAASAGVPTTPAVEVSQKLARISADISDTVGSPLADEAMIARDSTTLYRDAAARANELSRDWSRIYWVSQPDWAHRVVTTALPTLFDCFGHTDLLVTDISSVVVDYLHSEKPHIVTNSGGSEHAEFRSLYPTAAAAELLDPDCAALSTMVSDIGRGTDQLTKQRRVLKEHLLGPDDDDPFHRFAAAVDRAAAAAERSPQPRMPVGEPDQEPLRDERHQTLDLDVLSAEVEA